MNNIKLNELKEASKALLNHGVVAFPTDSVMGLGVVYDDKDAYEKLNVIKKRPSSKPFSMMLSSKEEIKNYAYVSIHASKCINAFLPGPITFLLKSKPNVPGYVTHNTGIIGIRVTPHEDTTELIKIVGKPLLVPSANISGEPPALNSDEVKLIFKDEIIGLFMHLLQHNILIFQNLDELIVLPFNNRILSFIFIFSFS